MPELPEVETVRAGLERHVVGRTVATAAVLNPRAVRRDLAGPEGFAAAMAGRTFLRAERRGKYLWFALDEERGAARAPGHERPAPRRRPGTPAVAARPRPLHVHRRRPRPALHRPAHVRPPDVERDDGGRVPRQGERLLPAPIAHIAPDPLEEAFDQEAFGARLTRKKTEIKRALLDQSLISGIGNIYADEALWRARLHWARPTQTLKRAEVSRLLEAVREVLGEALTAGGTSFDALYVNVNGESGYFDRSLNAYGREGEPCPRCGTPIRRDAFMNRSSYSCPTCQYRPRGDDPPDEAE